MFEHETIEEQDKLEQIKYLEEKLEKIVKENPELALKIGDLSDKLQEIINDIEKLEFAKENLQQILNKMRYEGKIDTIMKNGETHYIIKKRPKCSERFDQEKTIQEKPLEIQKANLASIDIWFNNNSTEITKVVLMLGILIGLLSIFRHNIFSLFPALIVIFIVVSAIAEIITLSKRSKENLKYNPPIYGIISLVSNVIGLIVLNTLVSSSHYFSDILISDDFRNLYLLPLSIIAIIISLIGFFFHKDSRPYAAIGGLFFGCILLIISLSPVIYILFCLIAFLTLVG